MNIAVMESLGITEEQMKKLQAPFEEKGCKFYNYDKTTDTSVLIKQANNADAIILANMPMPAEVIDASDSLEFIDIAFTGVDHVAMDAARAKGIVVSNASGYSNESVAELGIGMAICLLRNVPQTEARCRNGETKEGLIGSELKGKTVGIVGFGEIGKRTAQLYNAFGCEIIVNNRSTIDDLLERADIVTLHCPLNDFTRGLIDSLNLEKMKSTSILVNLARGPVVVSEDLADALNNEVIAGAGIDVFDKEPPLDTKEPLLHAKNTIVTPHIAFATNESTILRAEIVFENLKAFMEGNPRNIVK